MNKKIAASFAFVVLAGLIFSAADVSCKINNTNLFGPVKGRRQIASWIIYNGPDTINDISAHAGVLSSVSIFGRPTKEFIEQCAGLNVETYLAVGGDESAFDTPENAESSIEGYIRTAKELGVAGIDMDFEQLDPKYQKSFSSFLRDASARLHKAGKKLSICVGYFPNIPPMNKPYFYDPKVVGETCDIVRVMCYDMHWAGGYTGKMGPTSTKPWAKEAMGWWQRTVPGHKLVMGLPAYGNDYNLNTGKAEQIYLPAPVIKGKLIRKEWMPYEALNSYHYTDEKGIPHMFFASDSASTSAHLETVDDLDIPAVGFWTHHSVGSDTWKVIRKWLAK